MKEFKSYPKPEPKEKKKFDWKYWAAIRAKSFKKQKEKMKPVADKDDTFYNFVWKYREHFCAECGVTLREMKRDYFHHILPKRNGAGGYPYFRYEEMNIILVCWSCHQKLESAVSYPKMKVYEFCEGIKKQLLENVGLTYESKITIP